MILAVFIGLLVGAAVLVVPYLRARALAQVLEPIVDLTVAAPESHMGDITGGLASKRARINGTDAARNGEIIIKAAQDAQIYGLMVAGGELLDVYDGVGAYLGTNRVYGNGASSITIEAGGQVRLGRDLDLNVELLLPAPRRKERLEPVAKLRAKCPVICQND